MSGALIASSAPVIFSFKRTEVNKMKYESPEVVWVGAAAGVVESQQPKRGVVMESFPDLFVSAPAYEAHE